MPSLPATIEDQFLSLASAPDDQALVESLRGNRSELARFMMQAAEDETWTSSHEEFFRLALTHLTQAFFIGRLDMDLARQIVQTLYRHHQLIGNLAPPSIQLINGEQVVAVNPLFLGVNSADFLQKIRSDPSVKEKGIPIGPYHPFAVDSIIQYCERGVAEDLYRLSGPELDEVLKVAEDWQVEGVNEEIEKNLIKFIEPDQAEEALVDAYRRGRMRLVSGAIQLLNSKRKGERLYLDAENRLGFEFTRVGDSTLRSFDRLKGSIGIVHGKDEAVLSADFWKALHTVSQLSALDLSESAAFSTLLWEIPSTVTELDCSRCPWMNDRVLAEIASRLRRLEILKLQNLSELTYAGFSSFHHFSQLKKLDLTHCHGLTEREVQMIRQLQPSVQIIGLKD